MVRRLCSIWAREARAISFPFDEKASNRMMVVIQNTTAGSVVSAKISAFKPVVAPAPEPAPGCGCGGM